MSFLLTKLSIPPRQPSPSIFTPKHHWNDEACNTQADKPTCNEHILKPISLHPGGDGKWYPDTHGIAEKGNAREGVTSDLFNIRHSLYNRKL